MHHLHGDSTVYPFYISANVNIIKLYHNSLPVHNTSESNHLLSGGGDILQTQTSSLFLWTSPLFQLPKIKMVKLTRSQTNFKFLNIVVSILVKKQNRSHKKTIKQSICITPWHRRFVTILTYDYSRTNEFVHCCHRHIYHVCTAITFTCC